MPTLDWIGKKVVLNHHRQVRYRLLHCDTSLSPGDADAGNQLVHRDNLAAFKALLPTWVDAAEACRHSVPAGSV